MENKKLLTLLQLGIREDAFSSIFSIQNFLLKKIVSNPHTEQSQSGQRKRDLKLQFFTGRFIERRSRDVALKSFTRELSTKIALF